jgi:hypothetical protein
MIFAADGTRLNSSMGMSYGAIPSIVAWFRFKMVEPAFVPHHSLQQEALSSIAVLVQRSVAVASLVSLCTSVRIHGTQQVNLGIVKFFSNYHYITFTDGWGGA